MAAECATAHGATVLETPARGQRPVTAEAAALAVLCEAGPPSQAVGGSAQQRNADSGRPLSQEPT